MTKVVNYFLAVLSQTDKPRHNTSFSYQRSTITSFTNSMTYIKALRQQQQQQLKQQQNKTE